MREELESEAFILYLQGHRCPLWDLFAGSLIYAPGPPLTCWGTALGTIRAAAGIPLVGRDIRGALTA